MADLTDLDEFLKRASADPLWRVVADKCGERNARKNAARSESTFGRMASFIAANDFHLSQQQINPHATTQTSAGNLLGWFATEPPKPTIQTKSDGPANDKQTPKPR